MLLITKKEIATIAKNYIYVDDFRKENKKLYYRATSQKWWNEIVKETNLQRKLRNPRTIEDILNIAYQYDVLIDFYTNQPKYYRYAYRRGWLNEVTKHMVKNNRWFDNYDLILAEAKKYNTRNDFRLNSNKYYGAAKRHGWLNEVCAHMTIHPKHINRIKIKDSV